MRHPYPARTTVDLTGSVSVEEARKRLLNYSSGQSPSGVIGGTASGDHIWLSPRMTARRAFNPVLRARISATVDGLAQLHGVIRPARLPVSVLWMSTALVVLGLAAGGGVFLLFGLAVVVFLWVMAQGDATHYDSGSERVLGAASWLVGTAEPPSAS